MMPFASAGPAGPQSPPCDVHIGPGREVPFLPGNLHTTSLPAGPQSPPCDVHIGPGREKAGWTRCSDRGLEPSAGEAGTTRPPALPGSPVIAAATNLEILKIDALNH
jgi:hypothetical protein